jgi:hypothetical protein
MLPESSSAETIRSRRSFLPKLASTRYIGKESKEIQRNPRPVSPSKAITFAEFVVSNPRLILIGGGGI